MVCMDKMLELSQKKVITIGDVAKLLGVHRDTLRRWEACGYLRSRRHPINNYRIYEYTEIKQLFDRLQYIHEE